MDKDKSQSDENARHTPPHSDYQSYDYSNGRYQQGRWQGDEHAKFVDALKLYGKDWGKVQMHVGTRSSTQARSHAQKFFQKVQKLTKNAMCDPLDFIRDKKNEKYLQDFEDSDEDRYCYLS